MTALSENKTDPLRRVRASLALRDAAGLRRVLRPRGERESILDLAGNDYLGLSTDIRVLNAAIDAALRWGAGATGSRLVTGTTMLHTELETELAAFLDADSALIFSSGYLANLGAITALAGPDVTVVSDVGNHASIIDACRLSRSPVSVVPHRDLDMLAAAVGAARTADVLVVTEGVFSVDGDIAPLAEIHRVTRARGGLLLVDEAHALGVVGPGGRGAASLAGIAAEPDVVRTVTFSKSSGAQGGAVLAHGDIVELLVNTARAFIFDTALAPTSTGAALAALRIVIAEPDLPGAVRLAARRLSGVVDALGVETAHPDAAVVPAFLGDPHRAWQAAADCFDRGLRVGCFRPPSVPEGRSCLRLTARATLTDAEHEIISAVLSDVLG